MTPKELEKKTIASLRSLAKAHGVSLRPTLKKREIIDRLLPLFQEDVKQAPKPPPGLNSTKKTDLLRKKEDRPILAGHLGEGEAHDEKVLFDLPPISEKAPDPPYAEIPREYGDDRIVLLVRDPWWVYTYWEVTADALGEANRRVADAEAHLTLRVYDMTERQDLTYFWDIDLYQRIGSWYIEVGRPDRTYLVDVGMKSRSGTFSTIARSNAGHTPPDAPSSRFDEEWWTVEWDQAVTVAPYDEGRRLPPDWTEIETGELGGSERFSFGPFGK